MGFQGMPVSSSLRRYTSRREPDRLLHAILDTAEVRTGRVDLSPPTEWLQLSVIALAEGASMRPHVHDPRPAGRAPASVTQEAWVVVRGRVQARLYDEDRALLDEATLTAGQVLVTFRGGHAFHGAEGGTILVECKNGPYEGRDYTAFEGAAP
jgi:cupin fold WbuC family metalloprotein